MWLDTWKTESRQRHRIKFCFYVTCFQIKWVRFVLKVSQWESSTLIHPDGDFLHFNPVSSYGLPPGALKTCRWIWDYSTVLFSACQALSTDIMLVPFIIVVTSSFVVVKSICRLFVSFPFVLLINLYWTPGRIASTLVVANGDLNK